MDTYPLLVYLVGKFDLKLLDEQDQIIFKNLELFLDSRKCYVTPHILAEFNSQLKSKFKLHQESILINSIPFLKNHFEIYIPKDNLLKALPSLAWLGITDIGILRTKEIFEPTTLITKDQDLFDQYCLENDAIYLEEFLYPID